jgi:hypothetical protein
MAEWGTRNDIMSGVKEHVLRSKFLKRNTIEYFPDSGARIIRLHDTNIVTFPAPHDLYHFILNSGGWRTPTTADRMNSVLPSGVRVFQQGGFWYVRIGGWQEDGKTVPFFDGIEIKAGVVVNPQAWGESDEPEKNRLRILIRKYTKKVAEIWNGYGGPLKPDNGDCLICRVYGSKIYKGSRHPEMDCIKSHLEEQYVHGSLVYNAFKWAGYGDHQMPYVYGMKSLAVRNVRRFLKAQLGMEAR